MEQSRAKKAAGAPAEAGWSEDAGYESALEVQHEVHDQVKTALWIADCFTYTNALNRLNYFVGGETVIVAHLDRYASLKTMFSCMCTLYSVRVHSIKLYIFPRV